MEESEACGGTLGRASGPENKATKMAIEAAI
jgi:hypothetical protein